MENILNNIFSDNPLLSIGAAISLFAIIAAHRLILHRRKLRVIEENRLKFRHIIAQAIADIRTRKHIFKDSSHINPIHAAMLEYYPFLSKERQTAIDVAWKEYKEHEEYRAWTRPNDDPIMPEPESWAKTEAIKFLNNLLKFTE